MRNSLSHRGPDGSRIYTDKEVGLVHLRLSIIDLSDAASQPFFSSDKRFAITFNGEIFNYLELRKDLEADGIVFRTDSDTEVLLQLYIKFGKACLDRFNG